MHCPRCGNKQASGNLKFCSKCGLPMGLVYELISNDGDIPGLKNAGGAKFTKRVGAGISAIWFIFFTLFLTSVLAILGGDEIVALSAVIGLFGAITILVSSLIFLPGKPKVREYVNPAEGFASMESGAQPVAGSLEAGDQQSAQDFVAPAGSWKAPDTGDLVTPGSVTEGTTRLLTKEEEQEK